MSNLVTGDLTKNQSVQTIVSAQPQSVIDHTRLSDIKDVVNQSHLSGKRLGSTFIAVDFSVENKPKIVGLAIAVGSMPADGWTIIPATT